MDTGMNWMDRLWSFSTGLPVPPRVRTPGVFSCPSSKNAKEGGSGAPPALLLLPRPGSPTPTPASCPSPASGLGLDAKTPETHRPASEKASLPPARPGLPRRGIAPHPPASPTNRPGRRDMERLLCFSWLFDNSREVQAIRAQVLGGIPGSGNGGFDTEQGMIYTCLRPPAALNRPRGDADREHR